jgi:energy-coupling factor transporter ATP-binding protein EcfA2
MHKLENPNQTEANSSEVSYYTHKEILDEVTSIVNTGGTVIIEGESHSGKTYFLENTLHYKLGITKDESVILSGFGLGVSREDIFKLIETTKKLLIADEAFRLVDDSEFMDSLKKRIARKEVSTVLCNTVFMNSNNELLSRFLVSVDPDNEIPTIEFPLLMSEEDAFSVAKTLLDNPGRVEEISNDLAQQFVSITKNPYILKHLIRRAEGADLINEPGFSPVSFTHRLFEENKIVLHNDSLDKEWYEIEKRVTPT